MAVEEQPLLLFTNLISTDVSHSAPWRHVLMFSSYLQLVWTPKISVYDNPHFDHECLWLMANVLSPIARLSAFGERLS